MPAPGIKSLIKLPLPDPKSRKFWYRTFGGNGLTIKINGVKVLPTRGANEKTP
jgi:hypothetical protein